MSALFHWPCSISIDLSPGSVTAGARPFPLAMQHVYSFVSQVCHCWCPPFSIHVSARSVHVLSVSIHLSPRSVTAGVRPFPLAMCISLPGLSLVAPPCSISIHLSPRSVTAGVCPFPLAMHHCVRRLVSLLFPFVSLLVSLLVGHCARLVSLCFLLSPFSSPFLLMSQKWTWECFVVVPAVWGLRWCILFFQAQSSPCLSETVLVTAGFSPVTHLHAHIEADSSADSTFAHFCFELRPANCTSAPVGQAGISGLLMFWILEFAECVEA